MKIAQTTVEYVDHMGSDLMVVNAARQSFAKQKTKFDQADSNLIQFLATGMRTAEWDAFLDEIIRAAHQASAWCDPDAQEPSNVAADMEAHARQALKQKLIAYKRKAQHWAPFAHPHCTLRLRMPIFLARQFVKHQIGGAWSEESRRYMSDEPEFFFEPDVMRRPGDIKQGAAGVHQDSVGLIGAMQAQTNLALGGYNGLLHAGVAPEQAREILPLNTMTGVTWTGSLLFWSRVCTQRLDPHAQGAAQTLARQINNIIQPLCPVSWLALVGEGAAT